MAEHGLSQGLEASLLHDVRVVLPHDLLESKLLFFVRDVFGGQLRMRLTSVGAHLFFYCYQSLR